MTAREMLEFLENHGVRVPDDVRQQALEAEQRDLDDEMEAMFIAIEGGENTARAELPIFG